jgi:tetratricopeptide (TPR) repeat protein
MTIRQPHQAVCCVLTVIFALCLNAHQFFAQRDSTGGGLFEQPFKQAKLMSARHEFNGNNMRGALTLFREVLDSEPENADALFGTAQCHYHLKKYKLSKEYLEKAIAVDPKVNDDQEFFYGEICHRLALLDDAIRHFEKFLAGKSPGSPDYKLAKEYIAQCRFATEMMAQPVDVTIENMGDVINSRFDDYTPSITADGRMLVFTSRRDDTKGRAIDEEGDYKFFEDIYYSEFNETTGQWSIAAGIEGQVNTDTYDAVLSIAPSGRELFIYKNTVNMAGDIFTSQFDAASRSWTLPVKMDRPINTSYYEGSISMTADGNTIYFISEREAGYGMGDIYVSEKKGGSWSSPKNLGPVVNTGLDEKFVFIHPNGRTLYFSSDGHNTIGSYDIFKTEFINGQWSIPINLGYPINTVNEESTFSLTKDNKTLYIAAEYDDSRGERDIYGVDVSQYALISGSYEESSFGSLVCRVTDFNKKPARGVDVAVYSASSNKLITSVKTDKTGQAKVNVPLNFNYRIEVKMDEEVRTKEVMLRAKTGGETVENIELNF